MKSVRLYGSFIGNGSWTTVTRGWEEFLTKQGCLVGRFSRNASSQQLLWGDRFDSATAPGADAYVALVTSPPEFFAAMAFPHKEVHVVIAPHTDKLPDNLVGLLRDPKILCLPPSRFSKEKLDKIGGIKTRFVPHGVDRSCAPLEALELQQARQSTTAASFRKPDHWNLLHLCEGNVHRKGTLQLVEAIIRSKLPIFLTIVASNASQIVMGAQNPKIQILPRFNLLPDSMRYIYACFDAVIQPSRAEGFGFCGLEALCVGVPCIVTDATGHQEWVPTTKGGVVTIPVGPDTPVEFEIGSCPSVSVESIVQALTTGYEKRETFKRDAQYLARGLYSEWSWDNQLFGYFIQQQKGNTP